MTVVAQSPGEPVDRRAEPPGRARLRADLLAAWEAVYHKRFPGGPPLAERRPAAEKSYSLPLLLDNVLSASVMKTASSRARQQGHRTRPSASTATSSARKAKALGPDLTTVNSRFRPAEILESIVEPSKVISDQYKSVTVATADGKIYNGMPIVTDGPNLVLCSPTAPR